jgi:hypothetical protein
MHPGSQNVELENVKTEARVFLSQSYTEPCAVLVKRAPTGQEEFVA